MKCEQSGAKEDIAKYQLSSNSYNTAVELFTILAIPTIPTIPVKSEYI